MSARSPLRYSITVTVIFAALLWVIKLVEVLFGLELRQFGVLPRTEYGLAGILFAPLIHGGWEHLVGNTPPLILLGTMLMYGYPRSRYWAVAGIWILSGIGVWLFARPNFHFGASGVTHGIFFYLFIGGFLRRDIRSAALLMLAFYLYGGMLLTIFPREPGISFESHFFGAVAGAFCAYLFRRRDPKPQRRRYSWERGPDDIEAEEDDPIIGDQWRLDSDPARSRIETSPSALQTRAKDDARNLE